jgi:glutamate 5-kinase
MISLSRQEIVQTTRNVVVKVGTNVLTTRDGLLNRERIRRLVDELCAIRSLGKTVILVSSGAVSAGMGRLTLDARPKFNPQLQACAAIGQSMLIQNYEEEFAKHGVLAAQVLLTAGDLQNRTRYINARNAFSAILKYGAVPIVNENDAVSSAELSLSFGDNDRLASIVANLFQEPLVILLTDVDGLYDGDPARPNSKMVRVVSDWTPSLMDMVAQKKSQRSKGGMTSKLKAARTVTSAGGSLIIANGDDQEILTKIFNWEEVGTIFYPNHRLSARKRWFQCAEPSGTLVIDDGAVDAIVRRGKSLLPIGVVKTLGIYRKGDVVQIVDARDREVARGLVNYSSAEAKLICRKCSAELAKALDRTRDIYEEIVHRDNFHLTVKG